MGVTEFDVYGKYKFGREQQNTHMCLIIEAFSKADALSKARKIAVNVNWTHASEHVFDD